VNVVKFNVGGIVVNAWKIVPRSMCSRTSIDFTKPMNRGSSTPNRPATSEWFVEAETNTRTSETNVQREWAVVNMSWFLLVAFCLDG